MSVERLWDLSRAWYGDRHLPSWKRRTPAEADSLFRSVGLVSNFWSFLIVCFWCRKVGLSRLRGRRAPAVRRRTQSAKGDKRLGDRGPAMWSLSSAIISAPRIVN